MTRFLLTWIGVTILQLGPRGTGVAELRPGGESTRATPHLEFLSSGVPAREASRSEDPWGPHASPFASVEPPRLHVASLRGELAPVEPDRQGPASLPRYLPVARAPPA